MMSRMLSKPGKKAHFAKIMVIRWVSVKILSRDAVPSADFTIVYCKKRLAVPRRLFCFGSLVVLDVVFRYLSLC